MPGMPNLWNEIKSAPEVVVVMILQILMVIAFVYYLIEQLYISFGPKQADETKEGYEEKKDEGVIQKTQKGGPISGTHLRVIYGTEKGTAQKYAELFGDDIKEKGFAVEMLDAKRIQVSSKPQKLIKELTGGAKILIFCVSTYEKGQPAKSCTKLFAALQELAESDEHDELLKGVAFSIFALGDSSYKKFCEAGNNLHEYLEALGAKPLLPVNTADSYFSEEDSSFDTWKWNLTKPLVKFGIKADKERAEKEARAKKEASEESD